MEGQHVRELLCATALVAMLPMAAAQADVVINGWTYIDPTVLHVTSSVATGQGPVLLNNSSSFSIQDIAGQNINQPLTIYFAEPTGAAAPVINSASYTAPDDTVTPNLVVTALGTVVSPEPGHPTTFATGTVASPSTDDLYTFVGQTGADNSLNGKNITTIFASQGITLPNSLTVYEYQVTQDFVGGDQVNISGAFANGTIVFPFAENVDTGHKKTTIFDTSWTNTGFVNCVTGAPGCTVNPPPPPPPDPVPEPATFALLGVGLLGLGLVRRRNN
jgi:hypothetical protein